MKQNSIEKVASTPNAQHPEIKPLTTPADAVMQPLHEQIRRRAYELYEARNGCGACGSAYQDWIEAERELSAKAQSEARR